MRFIKKIFQRKFVSFKKILSELIEQDPQTYKHVQLASLHSTSKGVSGECGQRGGYMELVGFKPEVKDVVFKLASINLCSVVSGQALMELMINPPQEGDPSYPLYKSETESIHNDLESRAESLYQAFYKWKISNVINQWGHVYFPHFRF